MPAPTISKNFSGVIIDQNHSPRTALTISDTSTYYQTLHLPESLQRGEFSKEIHFPALSGFQILLGVSVSEPQDAEVTYALEQYFFGSGWSPIATGVAKGCAIGGERIWMDVLFDNEIPVQDSMVPSELRNEAPTEFRLSLSFNSKVEKLWYVTPNPYSHGEGYHEATPLQGSLNFRLLALVADEGTDFLGNPYRSVAVISEAGAAGANPNTGYWLSSPQPSPFAVVSHYSDVRPMPTTQKYGTINRVPNPNFEYDLVAGQPALWEAIGGTTLRVNRWRGAWSELEVYLTGEGVEVLDGETIKTFIALEPPPGNINHAHNPLNLLDPGYWEEEPGQFEAVKGIQYLEVKAEAIKRGVRLKKVGIVNAKGDVEEGSKTVLNVTKTGIEPGAVVVAAGFTSSARVTGIPGEEELTISESSTVTAAAETMQFENPSGEVPVKIGVPSTISFWIRYQPTAEEIAKEETFFEADVVFGNETVGEQTESILVTSEWTRNEMTLIPTESGLATASIAVKASHIFFIDTVMVSTGAKAVKYMDGDVLNCIWNGPKGRASSVEMVEAESKENSIVIDSILVDPITSGVGMNVYYSNDLRGSETEEPTIEQWERKLWIRVPQTYVTSGKTTFTLPEPIAAKFIKVEFTNLQAKPYDPGDYQNPVSFKKFPDWISEVFLALQGSPNFVVSNVGVTYDKLELMYNYYTKDLQQSPTSPVQKSTSSGPALDLVDPTTLEQIHQIIHTYTQPPAALGDNTLLGRNQRSKSLKENYPVEPRAGFQGPASFPVSSLDRSNIVLDQNTPVMFFYVTCRHEYKELTAKFAEKKAYFAGLKQLAFMRHTYTTTYDGDLYIESGADDINTDRNDFVVENGTWFTN